VGKAPVLLEVLVVLLPGRMGFAHAVAKAVVNRKGGPRPLKPPRARKVQQARN